MYQKLKKYDESIALFDSVINEDNTNNWAYIQKGSYSKIMQKGYSLLCMGQFDKIYPFFKLAS